MISFLHNLGLFVLRFVTGALVCFFAAREMANRSTILLDTLEFFTIGAPDIVKVFVGCIIMLLGGMLVIGFWTRFVSFVLLVLLAIGGYYWLPQESQVHFQIESLYGVLFFYLFLVGGGQWAASRRRSPQAQSVLDSEQSILAGTARPSIFDEEESGESVLAPPAPEPVGETQEEPEEELKDAESDIEDESDEDLEDKKPFS